MMTHRDRRIPLATQRTQKNDSIDKMSSIGLVACFLVVYVTLSFAGGILLADYVESFLVATLLSFTTIGIGSYMILHLILPEQMSLIDTRLLHELAKRKLIEFK